MNSDHIFSSLGTDELAALGAFNARVALATEVVSPRPRYKHIRQLARRAGETAAQEGWAMPSALVDLAVTNVDRWDCRPETLRLLYEVAYWRALPGFNPLQYFSLGPAALGRPWVRIRSAGRHGADGEVDLHTTSMRKFFSAISGCDVESYCDWGESDAAHMGASTGVSLLRLDGHFNHEGYFEAFEEARCGRLLIDVDHHPSRGQLELGEALHEAEQLAALLLLKPQVEHLLRASAPTDEERRRARERVEKARSLTRVSFLPGSGYCARCGSDITEGLNLTDIQDVSDTGCRACGATWCD